MGCLGGLIPHDTANRGRLESLSSVNTSRFVRALIDRVALQLSRSRIRQVSSENGDSDTPFSISEFTVFGTPPLAEIQASSCAMDIGL
jgi:hypothetical protein